jgi:PTH1 family peptidyl-tRNA hydrolase
LRAIIGIGNPGKKYLFTRHNIGFQALDTFAQKHSLEFIPSKNNYWYVESSLTTFPFFLIKPTTYVNNSGLVVLELIEKYKLSLNNILVIVDDVNLSLGDIRIRKSGGDGGHNGIKSIIYHTESIDFPRIRIGIANENQIENLADFVLSEFNEEEQNSLKDSFNLVVELVEHFIIDGISGMLNYYSKHNKLTNNKNNEIKGTKI